MSLFYFILFFASISFETNNKNKQKTIDSLQTKRNKKIQPQENQQSTYLNRSTNKMKLEKVSIHSVQEVLIRRVRFIFFFFCKQFFYFNFYFYFKSN